MMTCECGVRFLADHITGDVIFISPAKGKTSTARIRSFAC